MRRHKPSSVYYYPCMEAMGCRIERCKGQLGRKRLYCFRHWRKIPSHLQQEIGEAYLDVLAEGDNPTQETMTVLNDLLERADRAIARAA